MAESEGEEERSGGGKEHLTVDDDLREMAKKAAWSVSSCKPGNGLVFLRDDNLDTYWQSDGGQPHLVNIQFQKKVKLQLVVLYVDFKLDESYTPSKISVRAGDGFHNLKEIKTVELVKPSGWVYISLSGTDSRSRTYCVTVRHLFTLSCSNLLLFQITSMEGTLMCARSKSMVLARIQFLFNHFILLQTSSSLTQL